VILFADHGFELDPFILAGMSSDQITENGWLEATADANQGLLSFGYGGVSVILYWTAWAGTVENLLADSYATVRLGNPERNLTTTSDGSTSVAGAEAQFAAYSFDSSSGGVEGGMLGSWLCDPVTEGQQKRGFNLIASGSDATTTQLRFNRITSAFQCVSAP
jgi:hypothetical protein